MDTPKVKAHDSTSLSYDEDDKRNEIHHDGGSNEGPGDVMVKLLTSIRHLPPAMHSVLLVTALTWVCFSPLNFLLFKVYGCKVSFAFILFLHLFCDVLNLSIRIICKKNISKKIWNRGFN